MFRRKNSSNKKDEPKQSGAQDQGGIPPVPGSGAASEGACGQSSASQEDCIHPEQSQHADGHEEADGGGSSRATGGRTLSKKEKRQEKERERKEAEKREKERKEAKKREKDKQERERKELEQEEREKKERDKQKEKERKKMEKQRTKSASQTRKRNSSEDAQPPISPNESRLPQRRDTPSEGSQGGQALTGTPGATLEGGGAKQISSEVQGVRIT